jgi:hypothetical protein
MTETAKNLCQNHRCLLRDMLLRNIDSLVWTCLIFLQNQWKKPLLPSLGQLKIICCFTTKGGINCCGKIQEKNVYFSKNSARQTWITVLDITTVIKADVDNIAICLVLLLSESIVITRMLMQNKCKGTLYQIVLLDFVHRLNYNYYQTWGWLNQGPNR